MICNVSGTSSQKLKFATEKRIPAVHATWLWECIRSGKLQPYGEFQVNKLVSSRPSESKPISCASADATIDLHADDAGVKPRYKRSQEKTGSTTAQRPQRQHSLALVPSAAAPPQSALNQSDASVAAGLDSYADAAPLDIGGLDGSASIPLEDSSVSVTRRPSLTSLDESNIITRHRSSSTESLIRTMPVARKPLQEGSDLSAPYAVRPHDSASSGGAAVLQTDVLRKPAVEKDYSDILAQLRANRKTGVISIDQAEGQPRRRRQLGRATSTRSNHSTGDSSGNIELDVEDETTVLIEEYQPSQELGWDSPGVAKAREQMIKKLGGTLKERSVPVQGIGIVKDDVSETAGRASRKRRG